MSNTKKIIHKQDQLPAAKNGLSQINKETKPSTTLIWYRWNTDIGEILACAENPDKARRQVMSKLSKTDCARDELEAAIFPPPKVVGNKPQAFVSWNQ